MQLLPYQQRVVDESSELLTKLNALGRYIEGPSGFDDLNDGDRVLLLMQRQAMQSYNDILEMRISRFA